MRILPVLLALLPFLFSASPASGGQKYAFLVGISDYDEKQLKPLPFARNDIIQFRRLLLETGFKADNIVMLVDDPAAAPEGARAGRFLPECQKIQAELEVLLPSLEEDDELVLAFCGHGVQFVGENVPYFCPLDAVLTERNTLISMTWLYEQLSWNETTQQGCRARSRLLIMDACRKDPESRLLRNSNQLELKNLQLAAPPQGVVALFSCAEGQSALEHSKLEHGVFFYHLLQGLRGQADGNRDNQVTLDEIVAFSKAETQSYARRVLQAPQTPRQLGFFDGTWVLRELQPQMLFAESIGIQLAVIPAGSFLMGSPENEEGRSGDESPQHRVQISREFRLGRTEVTKGQFAAFVRDTGYRTEA
ncbi:MAG: Serine/threonine-protein kinase pkn1, partial [Planctomycetota bacterium]